MKRKLIPLLLCGVLLFTACSKSEKLTYSNLIDEKTQDEVKNILIENKINKEEADYFIEIVNDYNNKSKVNKLDTSKEGFISINTEQVPYDESKLGEIWDYNEISYMDFNCRLTSFTLFKDFIKSEEKFTGDDINLMFDIDAIENNPISKFSKEDTDKFTNLYASIVVENSQDIEKMSQTIIKEWEKRKISFLENHNVSIINVFLHAPEDENVFVGHTGVLINTKDGLLFIEKYGPSLPYQVSKFKNKRDLQTYLMDRLDVNTADNGACKPIIMENNQLLK